MYIRLSITKILDPKQQEFSIFVVILTVSDIYRPETVKRKKPLAKVNCQGLLLSMNNQYPGFCTNDPLARSISVKGIAHK